MKNRGSSNSLFFLLLGLSLSPVFAEELSLMLTPSQQKSLQGALNTAGRYGLMKAQVLFLQAIFYRDEQQWVIWLNDRRITPENPMSGVEIYQVTQDKVTLSFEETAPATLKVNQSYLSTGQIQEGDCRHPTSKNDDTASSHNTPTDAPDSPK